MRKLITLLFIFCVNFAFSQNYVILLEDSVSIPENNISGILGTHIIFPCNKTYFDKTQESWIDLNKKITEILEDSTLSLIAIHMYGAASPEGPYNNNVYLSINRNKRVADELEKNFPGIKEKINSYNIPEDYERLVYVTREDSLYYDISKYITDNDFQTKQNLQKNKEVWKDLLKRYYPGLRAVNIVIYIKKKKSIIIIPISPPKIEIDYTLPIIPPSPSIMVCNRKPMLRVKTNLVYNALIVPNWSIEFLPKSGHITPEFKMMWSGWRDDSKYKTWIIHAYEAGMRYYLKQNYYGWFFNTAVGIGVYDIQLAKNKGYLSKKYSYNNKFEIGCGYVHRINNTGWTIEGTIGLGCIYSKFDKYHGAESWATPGQFYYDWHLQPENFRRYNHRYNWLGPVNIGISVSYDILHYKKECVTY